MAQTTDNFRLGFQDLLFCGAGAMLLLFFIFAIQIGGKATIQSIIEKNKNGYEDNNIALISQNQSLPEGKMQTIRTITFDDFSTKSYNTIKSIPLSNFGKWDLKKYDRDEKKKIIQQVFFNDKERSISFILILQILKDKKLVFDLPKALPESLLNNKIRIKMRIIEGKGLPFYAFNSNLEDAYQGITECFINEPNLKLREINNIVFSVNDTAIDDCRFFQIN